MFTGRAVILIVVATCFAMMIGLHTAEIAAACAGSSSGHAVRLTRMSWQRVRDPLRPAAPPWLRMLEDEDAGDAPGHPQTRTYCVQAGDPLVLEGRNGQSSLRLAAVALEAGAAGDQVRARVSVTGAQVQAVILEHGVGRLLPAGRLR